MLTGRGEQLTKLTDEFSRCLSRNAGVVVLQGPAGFGKTAILTEFARQLAPTRAAVLRIVGNPGERDVPLAALRQLLHDPALPAPAQAPLRAALGVRAPAGASSTAPDALAAADTPPGQQGFCLALHELASHAPVVVLVDDVQHVDAPTLRHLLAATRSMHGAPMLLVLAESAVHERCGDPTLRTLLLQHPNRLRLILPPLRPEDVAEALGRTFGTAEAHRRAPSWHAVSGGNPLLLRALLEDHHTAAAQGHAPTTGEPLVGEAFISTVRSILKRSGPIAEELVTGLSVLGRAASPDLLSLMLDVSRGTVTRGLQALNAVGLMDRYTLRRPLVQTTLLDEMAPQSRAALHRRAAEVLHRAGGSNLKVAEHLLAAGNTVPFQPWAVDVLRYAAEQVLAGDVPLAVRYLELACEACTGPAQRTEIRLRLAAVLLRLDPSAVETHLVEPLTLLGSDRLPESCAAPLARLLFALGRVEEARRTLDRFGGADHDGPGGAHPPGTLDTALIGSTLTTPGHSSAAPAVSLPDPTPARPVRNEPVALVAEGSLQLLALTEATFEPAVTALSALARGNHGSAEIETWWQLLTAEAQGWQTPGWRTILAMIRSEISLWQGDLHKAVEHASDSLEGIAEEVGDVFAAGAIATQILAYTAMGRLNAAGRQLSRPVRDSVFRSTYGLKYLRARGHYYLATGRAHAALGEFLMAERLAKQWNIDQPVLLPWNLDVAEAWLRIGEREPAERLIRSQLKEIGSSRIRGTALRLHAGLSEPALRPRTLALAVAELERSGDRLELARALADLGRAHRAQGDFSRAGAVTDRAWQMAKECGADALCEAIRPGRLKSHERAQVDDSEAGPLAKLSDSELRVAALAAQGSTNREIAAELYITVSTVEQHLTRVYRKLNIRGRRQLMVDFPVDRVPMASGFA
ncbi:AAA family ATPase [Kitasatospora sp. NPDC057692]|uniref:helix-turn-helix transcriptional regulator n=1 Tax=Kitasatospora sp. NPDC057692 TaxID=3346215 RepID=UPI0036D0094D